ncbi:cutinase gene palindrome-binding protein [Mucor ambiguus]|uniref:Cutinase gene palindrome-binding protein n=1 Tax=Mucor ambiguus TaxID=91626 RepID=A0A0C9MRB6_9FUNG|nr:cutinase gene palindrome-binding protein [Mucor ambiguus]
MQQQPEYYSYLLDINANPLSAQQQQQQQPRDTYFNNSNTNSNTAFPGPPSSASTAAATFDKSTIERGESSSSNPTQSSSSAADNASNAPVVKGGTDFRRRKNWSERILVEITGLLHVLSPTGKILYCSESTHELTGYRPHELVGQALMDFLHIDDMDVFIRDFQMSFHTRSQIKTHYRFRKKDESYVIFEVVGQPKADVPGQPPQSFFGIAQPIPTKSGAMIDTFLELKAENNWLKKRIEELSAKYGRVDSSSTVSSSSFSSNLQQLSPPSATQQQQQDDAMDTTGFNNDDWMDGHNSDIDEFVGYKDDKQQPQSSNDGMSLSHQGSAERKDKWKRRKKHKGADEYVCSDCGTTASPEWRKGPHGPKTLCNACGLRWAKKNKKRDLNDD